MEHTIGTMLNLTSIIGAEGIPIKTIMIILIHIPEGTMVVILGVKEGVKVEVKVTMVTTETNTMTIIGIIPMVGDTVMSISMTGVGGNHSIGIGVIQIIGDKIRGILTGAGVGRDLTFILVIVNLCLGFKENALPTTKMWTLGGLWVLKRTQVRTDLGRVTALTAIRGAGLILIIVITQSKCQVWLWKKKINPKKG